MKKETGLLKAIIAGLYLAPLTLFFFIRHTLFPLVTGKVFAFHIVVELIFVVWVGLVVFFPHYRIKLNRFDVALIFLMGIVFLSGFFGINLSRSFWSVQGRAIGIFSLLHFTALYFVARSISRRLNWRKYFCYLFLVSLAVAGVAAWQRFVPGRIFGVISDSPSRPGSFLGNPSFLAAYLIITVFIGAWLVYLERNKLIKFALGAGVMLEAAVIFFTGTRGAILGLALGALIIFIGRAAIRYRVLSVQGRKPSQRIYQNGFALSVLGLIIFGGVFFVTRSATVWQSVPGLDRVATISFADVTTQSRLIAWRTAGRVFRERPLLGWGWENFKYGFDKYYDTELLTTGINDTFWDKPHNTFLEFLTTTGLFGFLAYLYLLGLAVRQTLNVPDNFKIFGLALLAGYAVQNIFVFDTFGSYLMMFIVFAYLADHKAAVKIQKKGAALEFRNSKPNEAKPDYRAAGQIKKTAWFGVVGAGIMAAFLIFLNIQIVRANNLQYHGINFILNQLPDEGIDSYRKALAIRAPYQGEIHLSYFVALSDAISQFSFADPAGLAAEAFASLDKSIKANPKDYRNYIISAQGRSKFAQVNPEFADGIQTDIEKAIALSPNRQENYYALAEMRLQQGDTGGAYAVMRRAIDLDARVGEPHFYFGLLALGVGDSETGWQEINLAKELGREPLSGAEFRVLANYYGDHDEYEQAIDYYAKALALSPDDTEAKLKKGIVHYYLGEDLTAKALFEQVFQARPDFLGTSNFVALEPIFRAVGAVW